MKDDETLFRFTMPDLPDGEALTFDEVEARMLEQAKSGDRKER